MNAYDTYRQTQTQTAAPGELVVMLYKGAARFVANAIDGIQANDVQTASNQLVRAQAIISELSETLDIERGGELARNLASIYEYMNHRLVEANLHKNAEPAREIEGLLRELLSAWEQIARQAKAAPARSMLAAAA